MSEDRKSLFASDLRKFIDDAEVMLADAGYPYMPVAAAKARTALDAAEIALRDALLALDSLHDSPVLAVAAQSLRTALGEPSLSARTTLPGGPS